MPSGADHLRNGIANAIAENVKAYDVKDVCVHLLGLDAADCEAGDPYFSKRVYVRSRLVRKSVPELELMARKILDEYGDEALAALVAQLSRTGVGGDLKNLIFAAIGPKPRIVLRDAINNVIEITENAEFCLIYDRPLSEHGLSWRGLTTWWASEQRLNGSERENATSLYRRLLKSMARQAGELLLFTTFAELYGRPGGFDLPALIPQVYLHYGPLVRQRMDFLLLLPNRQRVVIEVDGRQHYSDDDGHADTGLYAEMVREDRALRLAGYEATPRT
jgi:hypothetical protein